MLDANRYFEKQAHSALSLQLAVYYYSLQIYAHLVPGFSDKCHPLYRVSALAPPYSRGGWVRALPNQVQPTALGAPLPSICTEK